MHNKDLSRFKSAFARFFHFTFKNRFPVTGNNFFGFFVIACTKFLFLLLFVNVPFPAFSQGGTPPIASETENFTGTDRVVATAAVDENSLFVSDEAAPSVEINLSKALLSALSQNHELQIRRIDPIIKGLDVDRAKATFDPILSGNVSTSDRIGKQILQTGSLGDNVSNRSDGNLAWKKTSLSGTQTTFGLTAGRNRSARSSNLFSTRLGLDLVQPLKRDSGTEVNLVSIKQARLDRKISGHELRGFILGLLANVEKAYWDLFMANEEMKIVRESLNLAIVQRNETNRKITLGSIPESELAAAEAEVALRDESLINAKSQWETARISFLRLINSKSENFWECGVKLTESPSVGDPPPENPDLNLEEAVRDRPELLQAQLLLEKDELELIRTRNGLLPRLDFFTTLGKSGYSVALSDITKDFGLKAYDIQAGLSYEVPIGRREDKALHEKAKYAHQQEKEAVLNLRQLIQQDVLGAFLEARRSWFQIAATGKTVEKQVEKLRVENIKFEVGKTTSFQVAQAQRDLAASKMSELRAKVSYIQALSNLYRQDASLCTRRGIALEGDFR